MPSSSVSLLQGIFRTITHFIVFSFSNTVSGLLFMFLVDVIMFIKVFYIINEKKNDEVNTNLNSLHKAFSSFLALQNESNSDKLETKNRTTQSRNSPTTKSYANGTKSSKPGLL
jgi:ABC-type transport system involved in cytochrome bd biosynthesis fused ATPase/permease subunit